jgi:hypothetical protein
MTVQISCRNAWRQGKTERGTVFGRKEDETGFMALLRSLRATLGQRPEPSSPLDPSYELNNRALADLEPGDLIFQDEAPSLSL